MKKTKNILQFEAYTSIVLGLIIVILYETNLVLSGSYATNANAEFLILSLMELISICLIPLSLRLFKFKGIKESLAVTRCYGLLRWGSLRLIMLCLPMVVNTLLYYLFMNVAFGYMGIICLICLAFVWPSTKRCVNEIGGEQ